MSHLTSFNDVSNAHAIEQATNNQGLFQFQCIMHDKDKTRTKVLLKSESKRNTQPLNNIKAVLREICVFIMLAFVKFKCVLKNFVKKALIDL